MVPGDAVEVVGAVVVRSGLVLCAQRAVGELAGSWEFPGGKVEPGETPEAALVREIHEELGCRISVGPPVTTTVHHYDSATVLLTTYLCALVDGEPVASEHATMAWVAPADLPALRWAPADLATVELIAPR